MNKTVELLNNAFKTDPNAIVSLIRTTVPCNSSLVLDPYIIVTNNEVLDGENFQVSSLGLINGILAANNLPLLAYMFSDPDPNTGRSKITGFCEYNAGTDDETI